MTPGRNESALGLFLLSEGWLGWEALGYEGRGWHRSRAMAAALPKEQTQHGWVREDGA